MDNYPNVTKIEIAQQALELLEKAVATRGRDYVYEKRLGPIGAAREGDRCYYVWEEQPDCLIGVVLSLAGWTPEMLRGLDMDFMEGGVSIGAISINGIARKYADLISGNAREVLSVAQGVQDGGGTWGAALDAAAKRAALL